jgi:type I restriction enzyme S subunit
VNELPRGWAWATLNDIAEWGSGGTPKAGDPRYYGGGIPWAVIGDLSDGVVATTAGSLTPEGLRSSSAKLVDPGTVLMALYGSIGKLGIAGIEMATNQAIAFARPRGSVEPRFLFWFLRFQREAFSAAGKGATQKNISQAVVKPWPVPVPPLAEQRRIVAAIEEHLSRLDAGVDLLRDAKRRLDRMKLLILNAAFARATETSPLEQLADVRLGRQRSPKNHIGPNMKPYVRAANVTWSGLDLADVKQMHFSETEAGVYELHPGDVLLAEASGSASEVGKPVVWSGEIEGCCFQNTLIRVRSRGTRPEYLRLVFLRAALTGQFAQAAPGVGIHHLGSSRLASWPVPLLSADEQASLVADVESKFSLVGAMNKSTHLAVSRASMLRRAILVRAFRGELVPQDSNDEPASVLLERIAAERAVAPRAARKRKERTPT